jgi:hypothetical protein
MFPGCGPIGANLTDLCVRDALQHAVLLR